MISKKLEDALNKQIAMEATASFRYLAMASWCEQQTLHGCAKFYFNQAEEERQHMMKVFNYINNVGGKAVSPGVKQPNGNFNSIKEVVETSLTGEKEVTTSVHNLAELATQEKDYATYNFMQFYVDEQREEETLFQDILDKISLIGTEGMGLYYIDKEMETIKPQVSPGGSLV